MLRQRTQLRLRGPQVRARIQSGVGAEALPDDTLQKAEHVDLIQFGLIPEFVGRFPIMCSLQVTHNETWSM